MNKWLIFVLSLLFLGLIFLSCSDESSTEPKNSAPIINSLTANPETIEVNKTSILTCNATDANNDALTYIWDKTGGVISGDGHTVIWTAPSTASIYTITVTVSDGKEIVTKELNITVTESVPDNYISVSSPNGGENWQKGTTQIISWTDNITDNVKIDLYKGTSLSRTISNSASGISYSWNIPTNLTSGTDYKMRITSTTNTSLWDESNAGFTLSDADNITVTSPNGTENWQKGTTQTISWTDNVTDNVKIELYKGTSLSRMISSSESGTSYSWSIPTSLTSGSDYKIRITSTTNTSLWDESNAGFTINDAITVTAPNGGENWQMGTAQMISWIDNIADSVKIELYKGSSFAKTISNLTSGTSYTWNIPTNLTSGTDYKIRITNNTNTTLWDESNSNFTISDVDNITITSPNGGENWTKGTTQMITWTDNISENVKIELYRPDALITIASSVESNGSYSWSIPTTLTATVYRVQITSTINESLWDQSNANFTISDPVPYITVISPNGGEILRKGTTATIRWSGNISDDVNIDLYKNGTFNSTIASSVLNNGSYSWTITTLGHSTLYRIRITSTTNTSLWDESDENFTITDLQ